MSANGKALEHLTVVDRECRIIESNKLLSDRLGSPPGDCIGKHISVYLPLLKNTEIISQIHQTVENGVTHSGEIELKDPAKNKFWLSYTSFPKAESGIIKGAVLFIQDITDKKRQEKQRYLQEKMSNLGSLAANIAHEINNPLESILNRIGCLLMEDFHDGGTVRLRRELELIQEQVYQISSTTNALIAFSKETSDNFRQVDINSIVKKSIELCKLYHPKPGIDYTTCLANDLPRIKGSEISLEQCFVNIINNSLEALNGSGQILIETKCDEIKNDHINVNFIDNGKGIQPQYLDRIFEPFFSTKKNVYGTGLGLSISYGIIADHKGTIEVESDPGERTIMKILIPWTIDEAIENGEKG